MRCPYCRQEGNILTCNNMYRCLNHNAHVWFNFTKRIIGFDGYCVELCYSKLTTKVYKCYQATKSSVFVVGNFDYGSHNRRCIWSANFIDKVRPKTVTKYLHRIKTIVVFS